MTLGIDRVDPDAASVSGERLRFRRSLRITLTFVAGLWLILVVDSLTTFALTTYGVMPHRASGLLGLVTMPLLHGGPAHLVHNSLPTLTMLTALLFFYPASGKRVLPWMWLLPGVFVWLAGEQGSTHFGASGLNFALLGYVSVGGLLRKSAPQLALSLATLFLWGGMLSGILPIKEGISWEGHLGGLLTGLLLAVVYRRWDIPPAKHYEWEDESSDSVDS